MELKLRIYFASLLLCAISIGASSLLLGFEQPCTTEGLAVDVPMITDPCIKCFCKSGVVKCEKDVCPPLDGCHMILYRHASSESCCDVCLGCVENGTRYKDGDIWSSKTNSCLTKQCKAGVITSSQSTCPQLSCENPIQLPGQCCPSCPTCEIDGKIYTEGDTFHPYTDNCVTCDCKDGKTNCVKRTCPVLNCPASKIVQEAGECCPKCMGQRTTFLVPKMCLFQQQIYANGKSYELNECTKCTCHEGTMECIRNACPVLDCSTEDQMYQAERSCCPICKPKKSFHPCTYSGIEYKHGSTWNQACSECFCNNGTVSCKSLACDAEQHCPLETHQLKFLPGKCCPECVERDGLCTIFGDPHYITFDKTIYDFQGTCKYLLAKDCVDSQFAVYAQNFDRYNMPGAWTKSITITIKDVKIGLHKNGKVKINKSLISLPFTQVGAFSVYYDSLNIVVDAEIGLKVIWNTESYIEIHVDSRYKNKMCGMCGNFNGKPHDDFVGKDGKQFDNALDFAKSWQHGKGSNCESGITQQEVQSQCKDNFSKWKRAHQECTILQSQALKNCRQKINIDDYYKSCVTDSCNCPRNRKCTCDAVTAYVRECERVGIYNTKAPLEYSCSRQRRRIMERVAKNILLV